MSTNNAPVPIVPDFNTSRTQSVFVKSQIYSGPSGTGAIVPVKGNIIFEQSAEGLRFWEVASVDPVSHTPSLKPLSVSNIGGESNSIIIGGGVGSAYGRLRVWVDKERIPFTLNFDSRFETSASNAAYVKVFRGTDITESAAVVSAIFDSAGNKVSENIPLTAINQPNEVNLTRKAPTSAWCVDYLPQYETVTVVVYAQDGSVIDAVTATVMLGNMVASLDRTKVQVRAVELVSEFLSLSDSRLLEYPVGMTVTSDAMRARVLYDNGEIVEMPIDGNKIQLHGLNDFISSESGRSSALLLTYRLDDGEVAEGTSVPTPDRRISETYRARAVTTDSDIIYNVKMFVIPQWVSGTQPRWRLRYFLYTLERKDVYEVTDKVTMGAASPTFNGVSYGTAQKLIATVNLAEVSNRFRYSRHVQPFTITLASPGSSNIATSYWNISYDQADLNYGQGRKANFADETSGGTKRLRIDNNFTVLAEWLESMYRTLLPIYNTTAESRAPAPTHVRIRIGDTWQREILISDVLNPITGINTVITQGMDIRLEFIQRTEESVFELAMGSLTANAL